MNASLRILSAGNYPVRMVRVSTGLVYYPMEAGGNVIAYEVPPGLYLAEAQSLEGVWMTLRTARRLLAGGYYTLTIERVVFKPSNLVTLHCAMVPPVIGVGKPYVAGTSLQYAMPGMSTLVGFRDFWSDYLSSLQTYVVVPDKQAVVFNFRWEESTQTVTRLANTEHPWSQWVEMESELAALEPLPLHDLILGDSANININQNQQFRHMKTSGVISLLEDKTSADMVAFGESLVAPTVKTGDLLTLAKQAAARGEMDNPCIAILDFRAQNDLVRASIIERSSAHAAAVDGFRDTILDGFDASEEAVAAKYTLELTNGAPKLPGYFTPDDTSANADPRVAIMNAPFLEQRDLLYQRAVPQEDGSGEETEVVSRKKFTPDSIIARAIALAEKDNRFADVQGLVVVVDEYAKEVHVLFLKAPGANLTAFDWRAEALPVGPSAITLEVEIEPEAAPAATPFSFLG